ncbi:MocR-like pyridoxine biosynthesis transcription factor PdxR [Hyphococcus lacteus]|uniref:PLP-dependent aminotransferase family protein n=1 Tax=Hyphococcus lacteus TaxID=3143536 RepID=A0ABV3Z4D8_9PROT
MSEKAARPRKAKSIAPLLRLDNTSSRSLQAQLRSRIFEAISNGIFPPGQKLPSSRKLADELGVARNTVSLAYQQLISEGHLESRERSGVFVAKRSIRALASSDLVVGKHTAIQSSIARDKIVLPALGHSRFQCPPDWQQYKYPFLEGRYDRSLFPVAEWREASRLALGVNEVADWSTDIGDVDDEMLIDEIRTKLLPRRGIAAGRDEILITVGEQQALSLVAELFVKPGVRVGVEEPGLPEMRELLSLRGAQTSFHPIDDEGLIVDDQLGGRDLVHVTPSRQRPTGVTLSIERRKKLLQIAKADNFLIIEDDFECEMNYLQDALPAIRSLDQDGRVLYVASLSKVLAPGLRLGFLVAPPDVIAAARKLRNLTTRRPSPNNQRTAAFFLSLGHYDTMLTRHAKIYEERLIALRDALNHYRPLSIAIPAVAGGTSYWVRGPGSLDGDNLLKEAEAHGILIEPARDYFSTVHGRSNMFRMGVTSIPAENIRSGVQQLSALMRNLEEKKLSPSGQAIEKRLTGKEIKRCLSDVTLRYKTVYGEPCNIILSNDGKMDGRAGYANEDRDAGEWWVEGERWYRQWARWAYGEVAGFYVELVGDRIFWLDDGGNRVDHAVIVRDGNDTAER